jgi:hypothetical protein
MWKQKLTGLIWTVAFLVAAQFIAAAAFAHGGHAHHGSPPAVERVSTAGASQDALAAATQHVMAELSSATDGAPGPVTAGGCTGGCCGTGTSCCGAALIAEAQTSATGDPPALRLLTTADDPRGREPDGLIRPPRILA